MGFLKIKESEAGLQQHLNQLSSRELCLQIVQPKGCC